MVSRDRDLDLDLLPARTRDADLDREERFGDGSRVLEGTEFLRFGDVALGGVCKLVNALSDERADRLRTISSCFSSEHSSFGFVEEPELELGPAGGASHLRTK